MESDKEKLIRKINDARKKVGLEPYPEGHLEEKGAEELESLYFSYQGMLDGYRKGRGRKKKISLFLVVFLAAAYFSFFFPYYGSINLFFKNGQQEKSLSLAPPAVSLKSGFGGNKTVFILKSGASAISSINVSLDNETAEYVPLAGSLPLNPNGEMGFFIKDFFCDNRQHAVAVFAENITEAVEFNNTCFG